ncbi:MAG: hypothetical protein FD126_2067 [Elusimicrobia bacterium]|nr:MAG: hypothetical protein FD126_2067 [Elusimicrobiota bacterium]
MARQDTAFEPALAWTAVFMIAAPSLLIVGVIAGSEDPGSLLAKGMLACGGAYFALFLAVIGAMMDPLPRDPGKDPPGLRLWVCWGILGWCPPPNRLLRGLSGAALAVLLLYGYRGGGAIGWLGALILLGSTLLLGRPKDVVNISWNESVFLLGTAASGIAGLYLSAHASPFETLCGASAVAVVTLLHAQRAREVVAARWARVLPGVKPPPALDLSRYEVNVERQAPAERPPLPPGVEAQLVDTGSFRVDAAKMLDKLRSYQLADPRDFLSAWLRCAAASGAKSIELTTGWTGLTLRFDGRAFTASELAQPYQALVDGEGENAKRGRHLAYGLLGLYRLEPKSVCVVSRGAQGVAVMTAGDSSRPDVGTELVGTVIRVSWPAWGFFWRPIFVAARARDRFGLGPATLTVDGKPWRDRPQSAAWTFKEKKGWRACYRTAAAGRVRLYVLGTYIEELDHPAAGAEAWLAHDELELDISQSAVVRGELLSRGLRNLERRTL